MQKRIAHYELSAYFFGDPGGIRTPDPRLRRPLLYPAELQTQEQVMGIEPTYPAWKAGVLPLNYTCGQRALLTRALILYHTSFACASVFPEFNSAFSCG